MRVSIDVSAIPSALTGAGRYVMELARALGRREDVETVLVARRDDATRWPRTSEIVARAPVTRPLRLVWEQVGMPRVLRGLGLDVHHGPHYTLPLRTPVPCVVTIHDLTFFDHPEWHERGKVAFFQRAITQAARRADALVCVSETTAQRFRERFPDAAPVFVAPHGVDHARFTADGDQASDLAAVGAIGVAPPYVAFVGTLEPRKDVATLVRAFDAIAGAHPELTLAIAGGRGWGETGIDAALQAAGHRDRIRLLGYVDIDVLPALLRGAAAVAYPSRDEGFGVPVLEAMACGAPVITTAGTVMAEVAGDGALLVAPGDVDALAGAIDGAVRGATGNLRQRARARAAEFTWDASAAKHLDAYRSVG